MFKQIPHFNDIRNKYHFEFCSIISKNIHKINISHESLMNTLRKSQAWKRLRPPKTKLLIIVKFKSALQVNDKVHEKCNENNSCHFQLHENK